MNNNYILFDSDLDIPAKTDYNPLVSFCIPTLNDAVTIEACLESIQAQEYQNIEFVIVDGGSNDGTIEIAREYTDNIHVDNGNLGKARQLSIDKSNGEIIALWDADAIIPNSEWLSVAVRCFTADSNISTVWPEVSYPPNASVSTKIYCEHTRRIKLHRAQFQRGYVGGGKSLIRRECLEEIEGVDEERHWGEDFSWAERLKDVGYQVVYLNEEIHHDTMRSFNEFYKKQHSGAKTFTTSGFGTMGLTLYDVLYEQYIIGGSLMLEKMFKERNLGFIYFVPYILIKSFVYAKFYMKSTLERCKFKSLNS